MRTERPTTRRQPPVPPSLVRSTASPPASLRPTHHLPSGQCPRVGPPCLLLPPVTFPCAVYVIPPSHTLLSRRVLGFRGLGFVLVPLRTRLVSSPQQRLQWVLGYEMCYGKARLCLEGNGGGFGRTVPPMSRVPNPLFPSSVRSRGNFSPPATPPLRRGLCYSGCTVPLVTPSVYEARVGRGFV